MNERITALSEWVQGAKQKEAAAETVLGLAVGLAGFVRKVEGEKDYILKCFPDGANELSMAMGSLSWAISHLTKVVMPDAKLIESGDTEETYDGFGL